MKPEITSTADLRAEIARRDLRLGAVAIEVGIDRTKLSKILHGRIGAEIIRAEIPAISAAVERLSARRAALGRLVRRHRGRRA